MSTGQQQQIQERASAGLGPAEAVRDHRDALPEETREPLPVAAGLGVEDLRGPAQAHHVADHLGDSTTSGP